MLLGPAGISVGRAPLMYVLLCYLESRHGMKVDTPIFTKAGKLFSVSQDGTKYMLKKWVSGRECEVRRERDVLEAAQSDRSEVRSQPDHFLSLLPQVSVSPHVSGS